MRTSRHDLRPRRRSPEHRVRRGEVLRSVVAAAEARRDGVLPTDVPGVDETFADALDLLGALQLRWHARLAARVEHEQAGQPLDLTEAALRAWVGVADEMPGVRAVLDLARLRPHDEVVEAAMTRATAKEHLLLAASAGRCGPTDLRRGAPLGAALELTARGRWAGPREATRSSGDDSAAARLWGRLRALVPA